MKNYILIFIMFLPITVSVKETKAEAVKIVKQHHFEYIYKHIRGIEGNYVFNPADKGGETYGGIPRRFNKKWYGWKYIDNAKPNFRHQHIESAELWVKDYYLTIWVKEGFENIENKELALSLFDFRIHSSPKTVQKKVNRVLNQLNQKPIVFGNNWIDQRFNHIDSKEFILLLKIERIKLFNYLVCKDETQIVFYKGWIRRLDRLEII